MKEKKKSEHYVDNVKLYEELLKYKQAREKGEDPEIPRYVGYAILQICERLSHRGNFRDYSWREELVGDAIEDCLGGVNNYDPYRFKNAYGYFTKIAWYAFLQRIFLEKQQNYIKHKNFHNIHTLALVENTDGLPILGESKSDLSDQVIETFEEQIKKKLDKTKKSSKMKKGLEKCMIKKDDDV